MLRTILIIAAIVIGILLLIGLIIFFIRSYGIYNNGRVQGIKKISEKMSSGKKINSAADNAANLAIAEKLLASSNGSDVARNNTLTGKDLLNTSDGALGSIQDSLQRMRELSVQASNSA